MKLINFNYLFFQTYVSKYISVRLINTIFSESNTEKNSEQTKTSDNLYKIKKPWNDCLIVNKMRWKVQAARGN